MYIDSFHLEERALEERQIRDPIDFFTSLIGGGDEEEESTTSTRTRTRTSSSTEEDEDEDEEEEETSRTRSSTRSSSSSSSSSTSTSSTRSSASLTSESSDTLTTPTPFVPPSRSELIVTVTSTSSNGLPSTDPANSNAREEKALTPVVIGIIVAGSVIFGLIFFALIVRKFFQARRRAKRNTWGAGNIDAFAPPVPTVIEKDEPRAAYPPPTPSRMYGSGMNEGLYGSAPVAPAPAPTPVPAPIPVARQDVVSYNSNTYGSNNYAQYPSAMPAGGPGYGPGGGGAFSPAVASSAGFNAPYPYNNNMAGGLAAGAAINRTPSPAVQIMIVCKTFAPTLPDELALTPGESVKVLNAFDDGWCKVQRLGSNEAGMVPMECLDNQSTTGGASRRASSLYNVPQQQQQQGY